MATTTTLEKVDLRNRSPSCVATESAPVTVSNVEEGKVDTIQTEARYLAFLARLRPLLITSSRYLAYSSDVGESFRPIVNPRWVTAAYGVSWLYLGGDCAYEGYKAHLDHRNSLRLGTPSSELPSETTEVGLRVAKRAIFQTLASMLLPALTIHSAVKYSAKGIWSRSKRPGVRAWGPTATGLAIVPALPFIFDEPVERAVDYCWEFVDAQVRPGAGPPKSHKAKEKEL